jgi:hypothetical protein
LSLSRIHSKGNNIAIATKVGLSGLGIDYTVVVCERMKRTLTHLQLVYSSRCESRVHVLSIIMRIELNRGNDNIHASSQKCDNGSNIKALWGNFEGATYVDHGLQLCANIFLNSEGVKQVVRCMNAIISRFSRSGLGTQTLYAIRTDLNLPQGKPSTKAATRWLEQFPQTMCFVHNASSIHKYDNIVSSRPGPV